MAVHEVDVTETATPAPAGPAAPGSPLWVQIRPSLKRSAVIANDILAALGKRRDVAGVGRNASQDIDLAIAWLRAYDITALVATEAQHLSPLLLRNLCGWAATAQLPLYLLHRAPRSDVFLRGLARRGAHRMTLADVPAPQPRADAPGSRPSLNLTLPAAGFHHFLPSCQRTLSPRRFERVSLRHAAVANHCSDVLDRDGTDPEIVADLVDQILLPAPADDLLVTDIRALQLACWHHDLYLKTHLPQLLASPERQLTDPVTVDQALTVYRQPYRVLAATLAARQLGVAEIAALRLSDAHDGHVRTRAGRRIDLGPHTARALRAQLLLRQARTTDSNAALLDVPQRAISLALNDARADLSIRVHGRRAERHAHPSRWLRRLGLTLHPLT